jgi:hypothetical protein
MVLFREEKDKGKQVINCLENIKQTRVSVEAEEKCIYTQHTVLIFIKLYIRDRSHSSTRIDLFLSCVFFLFCSSPASPETKSLIFPVFRKINLRNSEKQNINQEQGQKKKTEQEK